MRRGSTDATGALFDVDQTIAIYGTKVQVKSGEGNVSDPTVFALLGKLGPTEYGLLVTLGTLTAQARNTAKSRTNLRSIDGPDLVDLILLRYDQFDSR